MNTRSFLCLSVISTLTANAYACDIDEDFDTDIYDVRLIFDARGLNVPPGDPRDLNDDGFVSLADARLCMAQCTLPGCSQPTPNEPPVAEAGDGQTVIQGDEVTLDAGDSSDPEGSPLLYQWLLVEFPGQTAPEVLGASTVSPSFIATEAGRYVFALTVNDGQLDSAADFVEIDAQAFGVPQNLQAVAGDAVVNLSWASVEAATSYEVIFGLTAGVTELNAVDKITAPDSLLSHLELENGQPYFYRVRALHDSGQSEYSAEATATPTADAPVEPPLVFMAADYFSVPEIWRTDGTAEGTSSLFDTSSGDYQLFLTNDNNDVPHQLGDHSVFLIRNMNTFVTDYWWTDANSVERVTNTDDGAARFIGSPFYPLGNGMLTMATNPASGYTEQYMLNNDGSFNLTPQSQIPVNIDADYVNDGWLFPAWSQEYGKTVLMHRTLTGVETILFNDSPVEADRKPMGYDNGAFLPVFQQNDYYLTYVDFDLQQQTTLARWRNTFSPLSQQISTERQTLEWNGLFYFNAFDEQAGYGLWRSDGTLAGTALVKGFEDGDMEAEISEFLPLGDKFIFQRHGAASELWITDGTTEGTILIEGVTPVAYQTLANRFVEPAVMNGIYFFAAQDADGIELWASDGTAAGTYKVKDINPSGDSAPFWIKPRDGYIIFGARGSEEQGWELWRSDGTEEGTYLIKDICEASFCSGLLIMLWA